MTDTLRRRTSLAEMDAHWLDEYLERTPYPDRYAHRTDGATKFAADYLSEMPFHFWLARDMENDDWKRMRAAYRKHRSRQQQPDHTNWSVAEKEFRAACKAQGLHPATALRVIAGIVERQSAISAKDLRTVARAGDRQFGETEAEAQLRNA